MTTDPREERRQRRIADLYATDQQFADARPSQAISAVIDRPELRLPQIVQTAMDGYAERPALGQRAMRFVSDAQTGRTVIELLPRFDMISYGDLWHRAGALAAVMAGDSTSPVRRGDRVAVLGFNSVDYMIVDLALIRVGAVSVPLQTAAPVDQLQPIVDEIEPVAIASSVDCLASAVELALAEPAPRWLIVFDYHPQVDDHREAVHAAQARLAEAGCPAVVEALIDVLGRGNGAPVLPLVAADEDDPLALLVYTSGSTGTPKGAMYRERRVANAWRRRRHRATAAERRRIAARAAAGQAGGDPSIVLSFMPMSHVSGRTVVYSALGAGGSVYFVARSDLSTFLEDLALVRPTQLNFVPRIWEMLFEEFHSEVARRSPNGADRTTVELEVMAEQRRRLLGGRFLAAMTGSAPMSAQMKAFVESSWSPMSICTWWTVTAPPRPAGSSPTGTCFGRR